MQLVNKYRALLEAGKLLPDARQASCVELLSQLCDSLTHYQVASEEYTREAATYEVRHDSSLSSLHLSLHEDCAYFVTAKGATVILPAQFCTFCSDHTGEGVRKWPTFCRLREQLSEDSWWRSMPRHRLQPSNARHEQVIAGQAHMH